MFWLPAFTLFAAVPVCYLAPFRWGRIAYATLLCLLTVAQVANVYVRRPDYATGYAEAAEWIVCHRESSMVFFDGINEGDFAYFVRVLDPDRSMFVLRGDRLLTSSTWSKGIRIQVHAQSRQDIQDIFDRFGVVHVVVERRARSRVAIRHELREFLRTGPFELVQEIPVDSTREELKGQTLQIYRYRTPKPLTATQLKLSLPLVRHTITVPVRPPPDALMPYQGRAIPHCSRP